MLNNISNTCQSTPKSIMTDCRIENEKIDCFYFSILYSDEWVWGYNKAL